MIQLISIDTFSVQPDVFKYGCQLNTRRWWQVTKCDYILTVCLMCFWSCGFTYCWRLVHFKNQSSLSKCSRTAKIDRLALHTMERNRRVESSALFPELSRSARPGVGFIGVYPDAHASHTEWNTPPP